MPDTADGPAEPRATSEQAGEHVSEQDAAAAARAALRRATRSTSATAGSKGRRLRTRRPSGGRDPLLVSEAIEQVLAEQGWQERSSVAVLMGEWADIVGADVAAHVAPVAFEGAELVLQAESTAWATQMRLLLPQVQKAVDDRLGAGVVRTIRVRGPQAPTWGAGPRRVKGRGPRDTYG